jgi:hypothetical protein
MRNLKSNPRDSSIQATERKDPILREVRSAREELAREIELNPEAVHRRALQHAKELGFKISKLKPIKPKKLKK